jgi:alkylation response protein AidB-like acyl-CoA dehydrogenase
MATVPAARVREKEYSPPPVNGDFYEIVGLLDPKERAVVKRVRDFMETEVAPTIEDYWGRGQFPHEIIPKLRALDVNIAGSDTGATAPPAVAGCSTASSLWRWRASTPPSLPSGGSHWPLGGLDLSVRR